MDTTLLVLFKEIFCRQRVLTWARELGAVLRLRDIHPLDFCCALIGCAIGDEERSIACARRLYFRQTGQMPEESSFYNRFTEGMLRLWQRIFQHVLDHCTRERRLDIEEALGKKGIIDVLAADGSQVALPSSAAQILPSTDEGRGGFKLTAMLSLMFQTLNGIVITDARTHDRKALKLARWLHGMLLLFDRGYCDYRLFDTIVRRGGFFITRLKSSATPIIETIHGGLGQVWRGEKLTRDLPFRGVLDVDALFRFKGGQRVLRVIRLKVQNTNPFGRVEDVEVWLVTNLSRALFSAQQVAALYRMRWEVERLFRALKHVGRLDQLRSANVVVIHIFIFATLVGLLLSQDICARMRKFRPQVQPSPERVMMLLLGNLLELVKASGTKRQRETFALFEVALWREGVNPNPGRPYATLRYAKEAA
jgi:putative transposase